LQEIKSMGFIFLQIQPSPIRKFPRQINSLQVFQHGLNTVGGQVKRLGDEELVEISTAAT